MTKSPFQPREAYRGPLTATQAFDGSQRALNNAAQLLADARLFRDHGRWARSAAMAILAIEEWGKAEVIRRIYYAGSDQAKLKEAWQAFRQHRAKNLAWVLPFLMPSDATAITPRHAAIIVAVLENKTGHAQLLDGWKQQALYVDCVGKAEWMEPDDAIDEHLAALVTASAADLIERVGDRLFDSVESLERWHKEMSRAEKTGTGVARAEAFNRAVSAWASENGAAANLIPIDDVRTETEMRSQDDG